MKIARIALLISSIAFSISASAALSPYGERAKEIATIAQDPGVSATMGGELIDSIRVLGVDEYEVSGNRCTVRVALETIPPPPHIIGARQFKVKVAGAAGCPVGRD
jgi:hypothetical protein